MFLLVIEEFEEVRRCTEIHRLNKHFYCPTNAHNVKKRRVIKTYLK